MNDQDVHEWLTLIFAHEIQAGKNSFLKITALFINESVVICFIEVYPSINNCP